MKAVWMVEFYFAGEWHIYNKAISACAFDGAVFGTEQRAQQFVAVVVDSGRWTAPELRIRRGR